MLQRECSKHRARLQAEPHRLRPDVLKKIRAEVMHLGNNGTRHGFKFARKMLERNPALRNT